MHYDFDEVHNRLGTYCTQWDYIEDRFNKKDLIPNGIKLSGQMPKTSLILKSERSFYFSH